MIKRTIVFIIVLFIMPMYVFARSKTDCDYTLLSDLKKIANNIDFTYEYKIENNIAYFDITITNITNDVYIVDSNNNSYYYSDTVNGILRLDNFKSGKYQFKVISNNIECLSNNLLVKTLSLPYYNEFYNSEVCNGLENYYMCYKWYNYRGSYDLFEYEVNKYKESLKIDNIVNDDVNISLFDKIINFILKYFYLIFIIVLILIMIIIYLVKLIKFRRNRFDI